MSPFVPDFPLRVECGPRGLANLRGHRDRTSCDFGGSTRTGAPPGDLDASHGTGYREQLNIRPEVAAPALSIQLQLAGRFVQRRLNELCPFRIHVGLQHPPAEPS